MLKKKDLKFLIFMGVIIVLWFKFISPAIVNTASHNKKKEGFETVLSVSDQFKVSKAMCSKSCCASQWPVSFNTKKDPRISEEELKKYVPSNFTCTGHNGTGCVCMNKTNQKFLTNRGNNH